MKNIKEIIEHSGIKFGTSGARGLVCDFTPEVCTAFTQSFLDAMKKSLILKKWQSQWIIVQVVQRLQGQFVLA
jgi:phosphomannomutase